MNQLADYDMMVHDAFAYAKEGVYERTDRWIRLILGTILLGIPLSGYIIRIYRGATPAPAVEDWGALFIDGLKLMVIGLIYAIPVIIVAVITIWPLVMAAIAGNQEAIAAGIGTFLTSIVVLAIIGIIIALFEFIGVVRFARTGKMGEAFNFSAIIGTIGKIGWVSYIVALIIMMVIVGIIEMICMAIPFVGGLILFILIPFIVLFEARYLCQVYDSAGN